MIQITEYERKIIQKQNPKHRLVIASKRKKAGGSTYYAQCDDTTTLQIVAEIRDTDVDTLLATN